MTDKSTDLAAGAAPAARVDRAADADRATDPGSATDASRAAAPPERARRAAWFDDPNLYCDGYGDVSTSALRLFPRLHLQLQLYVEWIGPRVALEVGPGDRPLIGSAPRPHYLDLVGHFLGRLPGQLVRASIVAAPFCDDAFELVVAADVFTHMRPQARLLALGELMRLSPRVLLFNPERGTPDIPGSACPNGPLVDVLRGAGRHVEATDYRLPGPTGALMPMSILYGVAPGVAPRVGGPVP